MLVYLASLVIPNRYTSATMVLIVGQTVPENYVSPVVTADLNQRLITMREQILSRSRLQSVIERLGLYQDDVNREPMEDLVTRLRRSIAVQAVQPMPAGASTRLPGFTVSVTAERAPLAQQICSEVTSMFMRENLQVRQKQAEETTDFLSAELDDAKSKLDDHDARLAEFKLRNIGRLPDHAQTNFNLLTGLNTQMEATTEALARARQDKLLNESLLAQQIAASPSSRASQTSHTLDQQLADLENQLRTQQARYTSDHPDVIRTRYDIEKLKQDIAATAARPPAPAEVAQEPSIQLLRAQIQRDEQVIRERTQQQEQLQAQIQEIQARVQTSPMVEQEFKALTRDHQTALEFYNDLLKKRDQSALSTDLERNRQGEQFRVLDPPSLPQKPSFPNRPRFALSGLAGGLALGVGLILLFEMRDTTIRTEQDAELLLEAPVLATIPTAQTTQANGRSLLTAKSWPR
jgi:polysaccharide chain length determinant protein (PEP-CTERM system associated)